MTTQSPAQPKQRRQKRVFKTSEIAHLWANQSVPEARNPQGNFWFKGDRIYSYSTCIARLVKAKKGPCVWLSELHYSSTTSGHRWAIRYAVRPKPVFEVPTYSSDTYVSRSSVTDESPARVLSQFRARLSETARELLATRHGGKKRVLYSQYVRDSETAAEFAEWHGLSYTPKLSEAQLAPFKAKVDAFDAGKADRNRKARETRSARDKVRWAEYLKQREEQEKRHQEELAKFKTETWPKWLAGEDVRIPYGALNHNEGQYARIKGDQFETTLGAFVPVDHVRRALPLVLKLIRKGRTWESNGHSIHLGHYKLDRIAADGTVVAGCHRFKREEVERIAGLLDQQFADVT